MKTLIIALLTLITTITIAQNTTTWIGGTPGKETNWNEARNWSNNSVPDEFTYVTIKAANSGHFAQPVIVDHVEVASIEIHAGAKLTIKEKGEVLIDGEFTYTEGIVSYGGSLINDGIINLFHIDDFASEKFRDMATGNGVASLDGLSINEGSFAKK